MDLSGLDLSQATGEGHATILTGAILSGTDLSGTHLDGADMSNANFAGAIIDKTTVMHRVNLTGAKNLGQMECESDPKLVSRIAFVGNLQSDWRNFGAGRSDWLDQGITELSNISGADIHFNGSHFPPNSSFAGASLSTANFGDAIFGGNVENARCQIHALFSFSWLQFQGCQSHGC